MKSKVCESLIGKLLLIFFGIAFGLLTNGEIFAQPGALDPTFGSGGRVVTEVAAEDRVFAAVRQPDGKIIAGGRSRPSDYPDFALARYNADGSLDATFGFGGKVITALNRQTAPRDEIHALVLQADGKIIAVGSCRTTGNAMISTAIVRYNADGSLDATFDGDGILFLDEGVDSAAVLQADGKIVIGGGSGDNSLADFGFARINPNGTLDETFSSDGILYLDIGGDGDGIRGLAIQPDGKIVAVGLSYTSTAGTSNNFAVARLNPDGSPDTTFDADGKVTTDFARQSDVGFAVALQTDGKIVVSGRASPQVNVFDFGLVRYNTDGSLDTTFGNGGKVTTGFFNGADTAYAVKVQVNGKIVAAGVRGGTSTVFGLARYNTNGSLDVGFGSGGKVETYFDGRDEARALIIQPDGKIVAAGTDNGGATIGRFALARYIGDPTRRPKKIRTVDAADYLPETRR